MYSSQTPLYLAHTSRSANTKAPEEQAAFAFGLQSVFPAAILTSPSRNDQMHQGRSSQTAVRGAWAAKSALVCDPLLKELPVRLPVLPLKQHPTISKQYCVLLQRYVYIFLHGNKM